MISIHIQVRKCCPAAQLFLLKFRLGTYVPKSVSVISRLIKLMLSNSISQINRKYLRRLIAKKSGKLQSWSPESICRLIKLGDLLGGECFFEQSFSDNFSVLLSQFRMNFDSGRLIEQISRYMLCQSPSHIKKLSFFRSKTR